MTFLFHQRPYWQLIFCASYTAWAILEFSLIRRDARPVEGETRDRGSRYALMALIPAGLIAAFLAPGMLPQARIALSPQPTFYVALGAIWAGIALRLWAISTLGRFFRTSVVLHTNHQLIQSGPYRTLRHPSYTGALITMTGIGFAIGNWLAVLVSVGCMFVAFVARILVEESALAERFGAEFAAHKRRTWALVPFIW